jgi:hypothetical protein
MRSEPSRPPRSRLASGVDVRPMPEVPAERPALTAASSPHLPQSVATLPG